MSPKQLVETIKNDVKNRHIASLMDWFILALAFTFIAAFNATAMQDRLLLFLYSMGIAGAALAMLKRGALVFTAVTLAAAGTALLGNVYFQTAPDFWHPTLDAVRDLVGLSMIAFVAAKLIQEISRAQQDARKDNSEARTLKQEEVHTAT